MDLILFSILLALALSLVALGLFREQHTELAMAGFVFLFLLSFLIINNSIMYKVGENITTTFNYTDYSGIRYVNASSEQTIDIYDTIPITGALSHSIGYYLAVASIIGFLGVLLSLRKDQNTGGG